MGVLFTCFKRDQLFTPLAEEEVEEIDETIIKYGKYMLLCQLAIQTQQDEDLRATQH